jgi:3,4-dihydroxy 2-butanone 4-phosphate synthase/GTP cyclohydrolase II
VICEILKDDGTMARLPDLIEFAAARPEDRRHRRPDPLPRRRERWSKRVVSKPVDTAHGDFTLHAFEDKTSGHHASRAGQGRDRADDIETLVRVHEPISVLDFLDTPGSRRAAFTLDQAHGGAGETRHGVIVLLRRPENRRDLLAA